jgi:hypothetical protein
VIAQMTRYALRQAAAGASSVTMTPADGLGYCECDGCKQVFQGGEPFREHGTMFAKRPDGVLVNITTETLFRAITEAAKALEKDYPNVILGCYAYSAYAHPPSFELHPQIYVQTTTAMRRTSLGLDDQMHAWAAAGPEVGIRDYWEIYQSDWDNPQLTKAGTREMAMQPTLLARDLRTFHYDYKAVGLNTEMGNNWAVRGLSYYVAAQVLWDPKVDESKLIREFYEMSFGPAAGVMQRYYVRWNGPGAAVLASDVPLSTQDVWTDRDLAGSQRTLTEMFTELDQAAALLANHPQHLRRVEDLKMYAYFLWLRLNYWKAAASGDGETIVKAIGEKVSYNGRLTYTNMVHSRPLLGKRFERRYAAHMDLLRELPEAKEGGAWRQVGTPPTSAELATLWARAKADLTL